MADFEWLYPSPIVRTEGIASSVDEVRLNFNTKRMVVVYSERDATRRVVRNPTRDTDLALFDAFLNALANFPGSTTEERLTGALHTIDSDVPSGGTVESTIPPGP